MPTPAADHKFLLLTGMQVEMGTELRMYSVTSVWLSGVVIW
jgi:hypothetical protein